MIITLTGENEYMIKEFIARKRKQYIDKFGDLSLEQIDCEEADINKILESIQNLPFLVSAKLVILRTPSQNKKFTEIFTDIIDSIPESIEVIILDPKLDKRSTYYKTLKSKTDFHDQVALDNNALIKWLVSEAKARNGSLELNDARYLVERVGANQAVLDSELTKLLTYDSAINRANIELLTTKSPQSTIFELVESAVIGDTTRALKLYQEQRQQKVEPQQIIAMLVWQLHAIAVIKSAGTRSSSEIASEAKINPYVVTKTQKLAAKLSFQDVKKYISDLFDLDMQIKQTAIDVDQAMEGYIMSLDSN